jgi:hypothetical protein
MGAKEKHRQKMLSYWGDPEKEFIPRGKMCSDVLKLSRFTFYHHFRPAEVSEIENEAIEMRKAASSSQRAVLYKSLYDAGVAGDVKAIKEFLDRTEGKVIDRKEITGEGGKSIVPILNVTITGD